MSGPVPVVLYREAAFFAAARFVLVERTRPWVTFNPAEVYFFEMFVGLPSSTDVLEPVAAALVAAAAALVAAAALFSAAAAALVAAAAALVAAAALFSAAAAAFAAVLIVFFEAWGAAFEEFFTAPAFLGCLE